MKGSGSNSEYLLTGLASPLNCCAEFRASNSEAVDR